MSRRTRILLKENNELEKQIRQQEDMEILTDIIVYIRSANISAYHQEMVRRDIWQMLLDGENRGVTAEEVIGGDYKSFCDHVIQEIPQLSGGERLVSFLRDSLLSVVILMVIWLGFGILGQLMGINSWPYFEVTAGNVISAILIIIATFSVFTAISKNAFERGVLESKKAFFLFLAIMFVCMGANGFIRYPLFKMHVFFVIAGIAFLFAAYKILDWKVD